VIQQGVVYKKDLDDLVNAKIENARALKASELQLEAR
jgi:hypothetical protein